MSFIDESQMYPVLTEYFRSRGYRTLSQASFRFIKGWLIDVAAYNEKKRELVAVEAKLALDDALDAVSQAEMYQMACSKVYIAFPNLEWESRNSRDKRRDVEEICKKRGIGILKVIGKGLTRPCEEVLKPALSLRIDLVETILHDIKGNFDSFEGFDEDDFSCFLDHQYWKKDIVKKKLNKLVKEIEKSIPSRASFLSNHNVKQQTFGKDYAGLNIFKGSKQTKTKHYSIGIGASFFSVFIQIPTSSLVKGFVSKLRSNVDDFLSIIKQLSDYDLQLYNRTSRAKHGRPMPGGTIYKKILTIRTDVISKEILHQLINLIEKTPYPAINFSKDFDVGPSEFYNITEKDVLDFIFDTANELSLIYKFIP